MQLLLFPVGVRLDVESVKDLRKALRGMGYSDGAVREILKWYGQDNAASK